jgi:arabinose-5-phosphate isomerase
MEQNLESLQLPIRDAMTVSPKRISRDRLAAKALKEMEAHQITSLFVFEDVGESVPVGIIHLHDLLKAGVV